MNLEVVLKGEFNFKNWSSYHNEPEEFTNNLSEFGTFKVYNNFQSFLDHNESYLYDENGNDIEAAIVIKNEESFNKFIESNMDMSTLYALSFKDIEKPILFGEASDKNREHFILVSNINSETDLITFLNEVLRDSGEVTHSSGIKNEFEVVSSKEVKPPEIVFNDFYIHRRFLSKLVTTLPLSSLQVKRKRDEA